jgi:hypothetical protein
MPLVCYVWDETLRTHIKVENLAEAPKSGGTFVPPDARVAGNRSVVARSLRRAARKLLRSALKRGPVPGAEIERAAAGTAISKRDLLLAADGLGVRCQHGCWRLPE